MSSDAQRVGPVASAERIITIDILRGVALFAILAGNMRGFDAPDLVYNNIRVLFHSRADLIAQGLIDFFINAKFVALFSFLFGLGFAVQLSRAEVRGASFLSFYPRRLAALALFGLIHGILIYWGDILLSYALAGSVLLLFRNRSQKAVLWWAGIIFSLPILAITALYITAVLTHSSGGTVRPPDMAKIQAMIDIYSHGTWLQILRENWMAWKRDLPALGLAGYAIAMFLLGLWVWRSGMVEKLDQYTPLLKRVCAVCLPLGLAGSLFVFTVYQRQAPGGKPTFIGYVANVLYFPSAHLMTAGYVSGLAVLVQIDAWRRVLTPFAAVGRMALTIYLMQSVICTVFYDSTGLYGKVGPAMALIPTVVIFSAQVVFSNWWFIRYRFGPVEWLWRGMTYGKFPRMQRDEPVSQAIEVERRHARPS